jgi:decaprenylphospho-beta-D-ribofuranose 2-oxidase
MSVRSLRLPRRRRGRLPTRGMASELLTGWGRTAPTRPARLRRPASDAEVRELLLDAPPRGAIARGLGRAYGDAAQRAGGLVIEAAGLDDLIRTDTARGTATVDAGVSLQALIRQVLPLGWFPAVTPGTELVTIGGAIACDVHGKNHHVDRAFCAHVESFELVTPAGETLHVDPVARPDEFWASAGGLGLTGVIVRATLRLIPVESAWMSVDTERAVDLDDAFARFDSDDRYRYSVAWIDCLARGKRLGRSVLIRGNHARVDELPQARRDEPFELGRGPRLTAPPWVPPGLVNRATISVFNELYFRRAPALERGRISSLHGFFYPLDAVRDWNRLYGPRGFVQYQFVVPVGAEETVRRAIERLSAAGCPSFLAVLKRLGEEQGLISFPMRGWTLALDVPAGLAGLPSLLDELDALVAESGGRVYLAKDSRLRPDLLETMYPRLSQWREIRARLDPRGVMCSDLSRRLGLVG